MKHTVALFPLHTAGEIDSALLIALEKALRADLPNRQDLRILSGRALSKKLRQKPRRAISACERSGRFTACIRRLIKRLRADELLLGRVAPKGGVTRLIILAFKPGGEVEPRATLEYASAREVEEDLRGAKLAAIFTGEAEEAPLAVASGLVEKEVEPEVSSPVPSGGAGEETASAAPQQGCSISDPDCENGIASAAGVPRLDATHPVGEESSSPSVGEFVPTDDPVRNMAIIAPAESEGGSYSPAMRYLGVAIASLGVAAVGTGAYFGIKAGMTDPGDPTPNIYQKDAEALAKRANQMRGQANWLFIAGSAAAVVGAVLFGVEMGLSD